MSLRAWWQARRERAAIARKPIPDDLWKRTLIRYPFLRSPKDPAGERLRRMVSLFLDSKEFDAVKPVRLTNDVVVAVAAQACLPVLELGLVRYAGFVGIVLLPHGVTTRREHVDEHGIVHEVDTDLIGEAVPGGPLMLSWHDVRSAPRHAADGVNVVIHEFAHVLDMEDGAVDGVPLLPATLPRAEWTQTLAGEYEAFCARVDAEENTAIDPYGAESIDEFFAVATEAFFVSSARMQTEHPALHALFARYFRMNPLDR